MAVRAPCTERPPMPAWRLVFGTALVLVCGCASTGSGHGDVSAPRSPTAAASARVGAPTPSRAAPGVHTTVISVSRFGDIEGGDSDDVTLSADGRFVAFVSGADNLVAGDTNTRDDVFVRDTKTGVTSRVNVSSTGKQGTGIRIIPPSASIDGDGRYVAFQSDDSNLTPGPTTACVVVEPGTQPCPGIFVRDLQTRTTRLVNVSDAGARANGFSEYPTISANGRYVAFISGASNLVPGDTNDAADVFVADLKTSTIRRVSLSSAGVQADEGSYSVSISADGRYAAFNSPATTLAAGKPDNRSIGIFRKDLTTGETQLVGVYGRPYEDFTGSVWISPNGRYVTFDSNGSPGVRVRDMQTGSQQRIGVTNSRGQSLGFAEDVSSDATGRYQVFYVQSASASSARADAQLLVRDNSTGVTHTVRLTDTGTPPYSGGFEPVLTADGRYLAFTSKATNMSPENLNMQTEILLRGPLY
jgi:Tol biopolymer transport system component